MAILQPQLAFADVSVAVPQVDSSLAGRFDLGAHQRQPGFKAFQEVKVVKSLAVYTQVLFFVFLRVPSWIVSFRVFRGPNA